MEGIVKWYNRKKGFGFIKGNDEVDYFVHHSALKDSFLRDEDKVSFDAADTDKGKQAQNVKLLQKGSELSGSNAPKEKKYEEFSQSDLEEEPKEEPEEENVSEDF